MPNSNLSGYSTASKQEIARINAENAKKDLKNAAELAKKDAEMIQIKVQMAEMAKIINNMQQQAPTESAVTPTNPRGRGRGQNSARGGHVGRGVGRGRGRAQISSQASQGTKMISRSESKKRGCEEVEVLGSTSEKSKFWSGPGVDLEQEQEEDESDLSDPRRDEDWKIQRRKGFLKDRESKAEQTKQVRQ